jgi:DNA polymerase-3 subunit gamma/tau
MCARVLLPGADVDDRGIHARLDRLERRIGIAEGRPERPSTSSAGTSLRPEPAEGRGEQASTNSAATSLRPEPVEGRGEQASTSSARSELTVTDVRRLWPEVLEEVKGKRRFTWILLSQNAQVTEIRNGTLLLAMSNPGARDSFARSGNEDVLREAMVVVMGADFAIETMVDPSVTANPAAPRTVQGSDRTPVTPGATSDSPKVPATNGARPDTAEDPDALASRDDSDLQEDAESHTELLARHLGAEIIAEEDHGA